jgi:DNA-binding response OmpR family regulator
MPENNRIEKRILIIEDDAFLLNILKSKLEREGYKAITAEDGQKAAELLKEERPSLILLDIMLPQKSGFEFMEEVAKDPASSKIPIFIISNLGQETDIERGKALGAKEYYVKAKLSIDDLVNEIKKYTKE